MAFGRGGVWVMGYRGPMGFFIKIPAHRVGGPEKLWGIGGYGLSGVWVMGVSTVVKQEPQETSNSNTLQYAG